MDRETVGKRVIGFEDVCGDKLCKKMGCKMNNKH